MRKFLSRYGVAGLFLFSAVTGLPAADPPPEVLTTPPRATGPLAPPAAGLLPQPGVGVVPGSGPIGPDGPFPDGHLDHHVVYGCREIGCYHVCPVYYSPYHVRPLMDPTLAGSLVRSQLAHLCIPLTPPAKDKEKETEKDKEPDKEPIRDK